MIKRTVLFIALVVFLLLLGLWRMARHPPGPGDPAWEALVQKQGWSRFAPGRGSRLHYLEAGRGEPVLLLHGFGDSVYAWRRNIRPLTQAGFRVLAVDLPGFGRSEAPAGFSFTLEDLAGELTGFLEQKGLKRVHVVGNSLGGNLALYLAWTQPARVEKVVAVAPVCYPSPKLNLYKAAAGSALVTGLVRPFIGPWAFRFFLRKCYHDPDQVREPLVSQRAKSLTQRDFWPNLTRLAANYFSPAFTKLAHNYSRISVPVLLVWGASDQMVKTESFAARLDKNLMYSRLVILEEAGHLPQEERPAAFNPLLIGFLQEEESPKGRRP